MSKFTETHVEDAALAWVSELGYAILHGPDIAPDSAHPERISYDEVILPARLNAAVARLNPTIPAEAQADAIRRVRLAEYPGLVEENRRLNRYLVEGVPVEFAGPDGAIKGDVVRLVDYADPAANDWLAVNQFTVIEQKTNRRPDIVLFLNGLPVVV
ncbi:MAG: type I restriction endonuclease, partial [Acidocella sp.]|nr:type I restriction endonuclease [Acidocella sp.]